MTAQIHRIPAFSDNYIWLFEYAPGLAAVIDPADAAPVLAEAQARNLRLTHILNTHWHPDHVGGNLAIQAAHATHIIGPKREAAKIPGLGTAVDEGDTVQLGDFTGEVLFVGAHTAGHVAYVFADANALFPGDTLFAMGCGRLFEGTPDDMFNALAKFKLLPPETDVYCAHEYTLSNAKFAIQVDPENEILQQRLALVQDQRARNIPTVPFKLGLDMDTNPFLTAATVDQLGERRRAKDVF